MSSSFIWIVFTFLGGFEGCTIKPDPGRGALGVRPTKMDGNRETKP